MPLSCFLFSGSEKTTAPSFLRSSGRFVGASSPGWRISSPNALMIFACVGCPGSTTILASLSESMRGILYFSDRILDTVDLPELVS